MKLLVATTNRKKLTELQILLAECKLEMLCLADFKDLKEVVEDGNSFVENAQKKALGYAKQTGCLTLSEDSGLCCDALEGAPGIYSARFAGESKSDRENNLKILRLLDKVPDNCRGAHFRSAVAIATPEQIIGTAEGEVHGVIAKETRGRNGFGYDPLFFYPPFNKTFGEVSAEDKHQVSHRYQALVRAKQILTRHLGQ